MTVPWQEKSVMGLYLDFDTSSGYTIVFCWGFINMKEGLNAQSLTQSLCLDIPRRACSMKCLCRKSPHKPRRSVTWLWNQASDYVTTCPLSERNHRTTRFFVTPLPCWRRRCLELKRHSYADTGHPARVPYITASSRDSPWRRHSRSFSFSVDQPSCFV